MEALLADVGLGLSGGVRRTPAEGGRGRLAVVVGGACLLALLGVLYWLRSK
jgi:hypothetical protein